MPTDAICPNNPVKYVTMSKIEAFIFDLDGTLCDNIEANVASYRLAFEKEKLYFNEIAYRDNYGLRFDEMIEIVSPSIPPKIKNKIAESKSIYYEEHTRLVQPNSNLIATMFAAKRMGMKIGLATTAKQKNAEVILKHLGLLNAFDATIYGENVLKGKPDPECYKKIINKLNIEPKRCIIFEDTEIGVMAAKAAGANVVKVSL
jgi:beta-phosphoglucomutase